MPQEIPADHEILASVVSACEFEYKDLVDAWRLLETKAQALSSVAGIFIAAAFAFARDLAGGTGKPLKFVLILAVGALLLTIGYGVVALFVRAVQSPLGGAGKLALTDDLLTVRTSSEFPERYRNFLRDQIRVWERALESFRDANFQKARCLVAGQCTLLVAAFLVSMLVCVSIWSR